MSKISEKFGGDIRWVNWKLLTVKGRVTKVPFQINGRRASSTDFLTWSTYDTVKKYSKNVGIILLPDKKLVCVDIDKCLKEGSIVHDKKEVIEKFIKEANSYTEISQSGTGLHIFFEVTESLELIRNRSEHFEIYVDGRYIAVTENIYGEEKEIRTVTPQEALSLLSILGYPWSKKQKTDAEDRKDAMIPTTLSDDRLIIKMFDSKNGSTIKSLYEGNISTYANDASAADAALCSYLAFWSGKDPKQMERIWLSSPLGARQKTQTREDYRSITITNAIQACEQVYSLPEKKVKENTEKENPELDLMYVMNDKKDKIYIQNTENMCRILRKHPNYIGRFRYDSFKNVIEYKRKDRWVLLEDNDDVDVQTGISILFPSCFGKVGTQMIHDSIVKVSFENTTDSAADYIKSLTWDQTPRLNEWLHTTYGTPIDEYHIAVGQNWLKGLVKRIIEPGCQFDYVLVLEGPQGVKKSTSLAVLGGDWHVETNMGTDSKDFFMQFQGKSIVEFSEGETLNRTEVKRMKAIITTRVDRFRPPFGRNSIDFPRRCVFAMTTNQEEYLKDETGNRRWLPVAVLLPEVNIEWLKTNREQLFAEAYYRLVVGKEKIYEFPVEETLEMQNNRRIHDPNADLISAWYQTLSFAQKKDGITIHQVYQYALHKGFAPGPLDRVNEMRIADVLRTFLKLYKIRKMINGTQSWRWFDQNIDLLETDPDERTETEKILDGVGFSIEV